MAAQLKTADAILYTVEQEGIWVRFYELSMPAWPEYQGQLASKLGNSEFEAVADSVPALAKFGEDMRHGRTWEPDAAGIKLSFHAVTQLSQLRSGAASAYNALAGLGGHDRVGDTIHS
ncbi:MAG: hypothetical protein WA687_05475 [Solirubrobacterales bacterium]